MNLLRTCGKDTGGFTIIELVVVISVLAVLTSFLAPNFASYTNDSTDAKRQADLATLDSALAWFYRDHKVFPHDLGVLGTQNYITPISTSDLTLYTYTSAGDGKSYTLTVTLTNGRVSALSPGSKHP